MSAAGFALALARSRRATLALAASLLAFANADATASTVSLQGGVLSFRSAPGDVSHPEITLAPRRAPTMVLVWAGEPPNVGPGCAYEPPPDPYSPSKFSCPLPAGAPLPRVRITLGSSHADQAASVDERLRAVVYGGPGDDFLRANGEIYGGAGDDNMLARGAGPQILWGGPGSDEIYAGPGKDVIHPGPGEDLIWLANLRLGEAAWKDRARDRVWARDGESDDLRCDPRSPTDRLLVDGLDWPSDRAKRMCAGVFRSSPAMPLPYAIYSPDYEYDDGTTVWVFCPPDGAPTCQGTLTARVVDRTLGPKPFRMRAGGERSFKLSRDEFGLEDEDLPATVTLRTRDRRGRLHRITRVLAIPMSPYDSAGFGGSLSPLE